MEGSLEQKAREVVTQALADLKSIDVSQGWDIFSTDNDVQQMRKPLENLFLVRGQTEVPLDFEIIRDFVHNIDHKHKYHTDFEEVRVVEAFSDELKIIHHKIKTPPGVANRESVVVQGLFSDEEENVYLVERSIEHPSVPVTAGYVRVDLYICGFVIRPTGPRSATLSYIFHLDPKGSLPTFFVNLIQKDKASIPFTVRELLKSGER
ncbi:hypothetical protein SteCoe_36322 [Stentor coeruleus]|uniref:START domain-containing protein n=1 Tax=Stentor coeruleus TaxID=5963 RepID=A0A1R2AQH4_9CILI|nr:hypothetical protein SteCoe_36322 [Stentor coeruleus]